MTTQPPGADPGQMRERTRTCAECGTPSTPGHSFCEGCGAVLSWSPGERAAAAADPPPAAAADDDDEPSTLPTPAVRDGGSARQDAPGTPGAGDRAASDDRGAQGPPAPAGGIPSQGAPSQGAPSQGAPDYAAPHNAGAATAGQVPPAPGPDAQAPAWDPHAAQDEAARAAAEAAANERARALLIPVADPERRTPGAPTVSPVLPGRPEAARPLVQGPAAAPDGDGGYGCPWCGTGNRPDRHFCRRCGMSMAERPEGPARLPWWRRLFRGNREVPWAGDRPRLRSGFGWILRWLAGAAALGLIIWGALNTGTAVQAIGDHFAKRAPSPPTPTARPSPSPATARRRRSTSSTTPTGSPASRRTAGVSGSRPASRTRSGCSTSSSPPASPSRPPTSRTPPSRTVWTRTSPRRTARSPSGTSTSTRAAARSTSSSASDRSPRSASSCVPVTGSRPRSRSRSRRSSSSDAPAPAPPTPLPETLRTSTDSRNSTEATRSGTGWPQW